VSQLEDMERPAWLGESAWPWAPRALPTPTGPLALTDVGGGPILLLVHAGMWSFVWRDLIAELRPNFRCVALDCPGNGLSYRPGAPGVNIHAAADAVGAAIDALDLEDITLVAHDLGGPAAFTAAALRPDRISGLIAINTFGWPAAGVGFRGMLALMGSAPVRGIDAATGLLPRATATRAGVARHWTREDRRTFLSGIDRDGRRSIHHYLRDARTASTLLARTEDGLRAVLPNKPLLTIFGAWNDPLHFQPKWKALFPDAVQRVIPRGGHFPMCDDPPTVARWIGDWHVGRVVRSP